MFYFNFSVRVTELEAEKSDNPDTTGELSSSLTFFERGRISSHP